MVNKKWNSGSKEITQLIKGIHNLNFEEFYLMTGFNFDQTENTQVYNIYSTNDPFAIHEISERFVEKNKDKIKAKGTENLKKLKETNPEKLREYRRNYYSYFDERMDIP